MLQTGCRKEVSDERKRRETERRKGDKGRGQRSQDREIYQDPVCSGDLKLNVCRIFTDIKIIMEVCVTLCLFILSFILSNCLVGVRVSHLRVTPQRVMKLRTRNCQSPNSHIMFTLLMFPCLAASPEFSSVT